MVFLLLAILFVITGSLVVFAWPSNKDAPTMMNALSTTPSSNATKTTPVSYNGTYHNVNQSTGWETTIVIYNNSFSATTISGLSGEFVASGEGKVTGNNLIDNYGQNVGYISGESATINFGAYSIQCDKKH